MKQHIGLQVVSVIDMIDDEVTNTIVLDLVNDQLVGVLWKIGSEVIEKYDEVVASFMILGYYTQNPWILDPDSKNQQSLPA